MPIDVGCDDVPTPSGTLVWQVAAGRSYLRRIVPARASQGSVGR
jgi:hypothetical protein